MKKILLSVFLVFVLLFSIMTVSSEYACGGIIPETYEQLLEIKAMYRYKGVSDSYDEDGIYIPSASSALTILQAAVGKLGELTDEQHFFYDIDCSGVVTASDALMMLQVAVDKLKATDTLVIPGRGVVEHTEIPLSDEIYEKIAADYNAGGKVYEDKPSGNIITDKTSFDGFISENGISLTEDQASIYTDEFFKKHAVLLALPDFKLEISPLSLQYAEDGNMAYVDFYLHDADGRSTDVNETPNDPPHYSLFLITIWNCKTSTLGKINGSNSYLTDWLNMREPFKVLCSSYVKP